MNFLYVFIVINTLTICLPSPMTVQVRTSAIYHRYYLIKRLEQSCILLQQAAAQQNIPFDRLDVTLFQSESIRCTVEAMKAEKSTGPLLALWEDFCGYKDTYNELFKYEFIELIYIIFDLMHPIRIKRSDRSPEHTLAAIDSFVDAKRFSGYLLRAQPQELADVSTDLVAKRFYIIKRLQKSMQLLAHLHEQDFGFSDEDAVRSDTSQLIHEIEHFHHDRVRESVIQMCQTKNLEPVLRLCDEVKQFRFAQDESFLQEMLMNIFLVYKTILFKHGPHHADHVIVHEMNHVLEIYEHLNSMPLDETLEAIDMVTDKLMAIQAEEFAAPNYQQWAVIGGICSCIGIGAYYYFVHHG